MSDKRIPNALKETLSKLTTGKKSLVDLEGEWRKCRNPRRRSELRRKLRA